MAGTFGHWVPERARLRAITAVVAVIATVASIVGALPTSASTAPSQGTLKGWGANGSGQLAANSVTTPQSATPVAITLAHATAIAVGGAHTLALADGTLYAWGDNSHGQLGRPVGGSSFVPVPVAVPGSVLDVAAGATHSLALTSDGSVWAWGNNLNGQSGGLTDVDSPTPARVSALTVGSTVPAPLTGIVAITAGANHNLALDNNGQVWAWGDNTLGELGNATVGGARNSVATLVLNLPIDPRITGISAGGTHSLLVRANGTVSAWGDNSSGQLGQNVLTPANPIPAQVAGLPSIAAVAAGGAHSLALASDVVLPAANPPVPSPDARKVFAWGANNLGQLGNGSTLASSTPVVGTTGAIAIKSDHTVESWGSDAAGQLGNDATLQNKTTAVKVSGITTATALAAGGSNSIAIVAPLVTLSSTAVNFSDQEVGTTSSATTITVSNAGPGPLKTSPPVLSDDQQFTISDGCSAAEIQPSSTCSFSFTFTPGNTGLRQATLTFADNSVERTHTITLKGRGTVASGALHVTVDESAVPAGPASVPNSALSYQATAPKIGVGDLPLNNLGIGDIGLNNLGIGDLPLNNLGIGDLPLNNLGVGDLPLNNLGIGDIGLNNLGIGDLPLNNLGIGPIPLTGLPLRADRVPGGWASVLANTQFDPSIRLLQDLTAADVFGANPLPGTVANIKVGDIDWANSLLHDLSPMAIVLGSTPAAAVKDPAINWCTEFANAGEQDCSLAEKIDLVVFQLSRASLPRALSAVKLGNIDMDGSVTFPSGTRTVAPAPLWTFKLSGLDMNTTDFGAIKVVNASSVVDCAGNALCSAGSTATLNDAARAGKIKPAATIGDLGPAIANFTLAEATFALLPGVFLGPVPASQAGVLTYPGTPTTAKLHYHLLVTTTGVTTTAPQATIVFPPSVRIVPGTSVTHLNSGTGSSASDPVVTLTSDGMTATWSTLPTIPANGTLTLDVAVFPGQVVGPLAVQRASVTSASSFSASLTTPADLASANTEVTDGYFEANNTVPASCPSSTKVQLTPGRVYYTHLSHRDDVEFFCFAAPPAGAIGKVDVVPTDIDVDAALLYSKDTPRDAPLRTPKTTASPVSSLGDQAASLRRGDSISSDNVDMPLPVGYAVADVSNQRGLASENLAAVSPGGTGFFIVEVTSHGGAISRNPIALSLTITPLVAAPAPTARTYASDTTPYSGSDESSTTGVLPASIPSDTKSLILVNRDGLNDDYGAASTSAFITKLNNLVTFLGAGNRTVIVPIDGDAAVRSAMQAADAAPGDIALNNAVVRKTNDVVDRLVAASGAHLQNIVLAGGSQQIRYPLCRDFTVQANERSFAGQLLVGGKTNALSAALSAGFRPCDDAYFDMNPEPTAVGWRYVPTIAGSRLLENLVEMGNQVDKFIAKGGVIDLGSTAKALAVGTDFMTDLAADTDTSNGQAFSNHALLNGSAWSDADLQSALDGTRVASINTHFDPSRALAPASGSKLFTVSTLNQMTLPELAITSSIGCHAGLSTSDILSTDPAKLQDWAQAFTAKGVIYAAPTTYGLGFKDAIGLHELLSKYLAANIDAMRTSGMSIGQALVDSEQRYMGGRLAYGVYDDKVNLALTGLPFWKAAGAGTTSAPPAPSTNAVDPYTGLASTEITATPALVRNDTSLGSYFSAQAGTQSVWDRPVEPSMEFPVAADATGAMVTSLTQRDDLTQFDPVIARVQMAATASLPESQVISRFPENLVTVTATDTAFGTTARAVYSPGQFLDGQLVGRTVVGTQRLFDNASLLVLHRKAGDTDDIKPTASKFRAVIRGGVAYFRVDATDQTALGTAGTVKRVLLLVKPKGTAAATYLSVDLAPGPGSAWTGAAALPANTAAIEGFGQIVDASGNVGVFGPLEASGEPALPSGISAQVDGTSVTFTAPTGVKLQLSVDGGALTDETGAFNLPAYDGLHVVDIVTSTGAVGVLYVVRDASGPQVGIFRPADGALYVLNQGVKALYFCRDAATPITSCTGPVPNGQNINTSTRGAFIFTVNAVDSAQHASSAHTSYIIGYQFNGFFGVANEPSLNSANAGSTIPVYWSIQDGNGNYISDTTIGQGHPIVSITWYQVQCPTGQTPAGVANDAGSSGLRYDSSTNQYKYNWKTDTSWQNTCRRFVVTTDDTAIHTFLTKLT